MTQSITSDNLTEIGEVPRVGFQALCALVRWLGSRHERSFALPGLGDAADGTAAQFGAASRTGGPAADPRRSGCRGDER